MAMKCFSKVAGKISILILLCCAAWSVQAGSTEKSNQAAVSTSVQMSLPGDDQSHEFAFTHGKVRLTAAGDWKVEAWVQHAGLLCGTYRIGVQFGVGKQGCQDVDWLQQPVFVTRHKQCNNAVVHHTGYGETPQLAEQFTAISCVRRTVRCSGKCAASGGNVVSGPLM